MKTRATVVEARATVVEARATVLEARAHMLIHRCKYFVCVALLFEFVQASSRVTAASQCSAAVLALSEKAFCPTVFH